MELIKSRDNPKVKRARSLQRHRERHRAGEFLVEGVRLVEEATKRKAPLTEAFITPQLEETPRGSGLVSSLEAAGTPVHRVTEEVLATVAQTEAPQGVMAISRFVELPLLPTTKPIYLVIDGVRDPGNVGTILRTAQGAGADGVFFMKGTADIWSPKVVRSAMGAHFAVPIRHLASLGELPAVEEVVVSDIAGGEPHYTIDWRRSIALIVGGEAYGPGREARARATRVVSIPMLRDTDSLNVAVATGVILFEALRQRAEGDLQPI